MFIDDSTGKKKTMDARSRSAILSFVFVVGICLGVMASEKLYVLNQETDQPSGSTVRSRKLEVGSGGGGASTAGSLSAAGSASGSAAAKRRNTGEPRNDLERLLRKVAPQGEVMIAISNMNLIREGSLTMWLDCAQKITSKNWLVVSIDDELHRYLEGRGLPSYRRPVIIPDTQKDTGSNHAISAMKYEIIKEFLDLGWDVLLSDVDIVIIQDPFANLYRDSDVEGMSDGFDDATAYGAIYGVDDPSMGWSRYAQGYQHMAMNSGLFYLKSNERTIDLMGRIAARLHREKAWDQSVYNEEIFRLSHGEFRSPQVSVRVMDIMAFMNTKVLFKKVRHLPKASQPRPVMVHSNYHPDKSARMRAVIKYYLEGDDQALKTFPGGSEPGS